MKDFIQSQQNNKKSELNTFRGKKISYHESCEKMKKKSINPCPLEKYKSTQKIYVTDPQKQYICKRKYLKLQQQGKHQFLFLKNINHSPISKNTNIPKDINYNKNNIVRYSQTDVRSNPKKLLKEIINNSKNFLERSKQKNKKKIIEKNKEIITPQLSEQIIQVYNQAQSISNFWGYPLHKQIFRNRICISKQRKKLNKQQKNEQNLYKKIKKLSLKIQGTYEQNLYEQDVEQSYTPIILNPQQLLIIQQNIKEYLKSEYGSFKKCPNRIFLIEYDSQQKQGDIIFEFKAKKLKFHPNFICSICYCKIKKVDIVKILNCKHQFHSLCINKWLQSNNNCPYCRQIAYLENV